MRNVNRAAMTSGRVSGSLTPWPPHRPPENTQARRLRVGAQPAGIASDKHAMVQVAALAHSPSLGDMEQLESDDIAAAVVYAVTQPRRVNVNILTLYPTQQA